LTELRLQVLVAIGRGATHGYAIGRDIEERTDRRIDVTTGALYQALKYLKREGLIRDARGPAAETDARRNYFTLTAAGSRAVATEMARLEQLIVTARERRLYGTK
jgi:DNA-binding PadR family transcriptional regulator